jgi:hypothetical protein
VLPTVALPSWSADLTAAVQAAGEDVTRCLQVAAKYGDQLPVTRMDGIAR